MLRRGSHVGRLLLALLLLSATDGCLLTDASSGELSESPEPVCGEEDRCTSSGGQGGAADGIAGAGGGQGGAAAGSP